LSQQNTQKIDLLARNNVFLEYLIKIIHHMERKRSERLRFGVRFWDLKLLEFLLYQVPIFRIRVRAWAFLTLQDSSNQW